MENERPHRGFITSVFGCYCPRCREGKLFKHPLSFRLKRNMEMHDRCPVCQQPTDIEIGFYYGTGYVSYLVVLLFSIISFLLWFLTIGFSLHDRRFTVWIISNSITLVLLQPYLMRFARSLWISIFVSYDPGWSHNKPQDPERINKDQTNNW